MPLYSLSLSKRIDVQIEELKFHRSEIFPLLACLCAEVNKAEFAGKCPVNIYMETDYANIPAIWKQQLLLKEIYLKSPSFEVARRDITCINVNILRILQELNLQFDVRHILHTFNVCRITALYFCNVHA